jgi:hypothetical protein
MVRSGKINPEAAMKLKYMIGATALALLLAGVAYPQQEQEKEKPAQQQEKPAEQPKEQPKEKPKQAPRQQQDQEKQQQQTEKKQQDQQKQVTKQQQEEQKQQQRQQPQVAKQHQTDPQQRDAQHSDRNHGQRIPDDRFRASFGREHTFRVERRDDRRFQFGGFWFTYNEAWPGDWAYSDDVYVDYIDGEYYLIDMRHPAVRLLLVVG